MQVALTVKSAYDSLTDMTIGDGAKGVEKGQQVTVRDVRALRVKLLNHVKLSEHIGGHVDQMLTEINKIGDESDGRTLLARSLHLLHVIASDTSQKQSTRWRAAKTIAETITEVSKDSTRARIAASTLAQQSEEHSDKVRLKERELDFAEGMGQAMNTSMPSPLSNITTDTLRGMLTNGSAQTKDADAAAHS